MVTASSEKEAREDGLDWEDYDAIWYEYDLVRGLLVNGKPRWDLPPACPADVRPPNKEKRKRRRRKA